MVVVPEREREVNYIKCLKGWHTYNYGALVTMVGSIIRWMAIENDREATQHM